MFKLTRLKKCENGKLSLGNSTGLIVRIGDYTFRGAETTDKGDEAPLKMV